MIHFSRSLPARLEAPFPELEALLRLADRSQSLGRVEQLTTLHHGNRSYPLLSLSFGSVKPEAPTLIFTAGVHGLEKIGTQILLAFLASTLELLSWDDSLKAQLERSRIVFYPLVNPVGMHLRRRSNGSGVDLMRNAPIEAEGKTFPLVGGHRHSPSLPWYRGTGEGMERESQVLCRLVAQCSGQSHATLALDLHSGFGLRDRLWYPYASSARYFPDAPRMLAIKQLLDAAYPHHPYIIEPQHHSYTTHGDLWDYIDLERRASGQSHPFVPMTLEMGSWTWIRKNPRQLFSALGLFHPILPHRVQRAERRHFLLLNFLVKLIASPGAWIERGEGLEEATRSLWYNPETGHLKSRSAGFK